MDPSLGTGGPFQRTDQQTSRPAPPWPSATRHICGLYPVNSFTGREREGKREGESAGTWLGEVHWFAWEEMEGHRIARRISQPAAPCCRLAACQLRVWRSGLANNDVSSQEDEGGGQTGAEGSMLRRRRTISHYSALPQRVQAARRTDMHISTRGRGPPGWVAALPFV